MSKTVAYELATPVTHNGQTYQHLTFRSARAKDAMVADRFDHQFSKILAMLASMSDVPLPAFQEIEMSDLNQIVEKVGHLLGEPIAPKTGATS